MLAESPEKIQFLLMLDTYDIVFDNHMHPRHKKTWLEKALPHFQKHEIRFITLFSGFFLATIILLAGLGLVPSEFQSDTDNSNILDKVKNAAISPLTGGENIAPVNSLVEYEYPVRIVIPSTATDGVIKNPTSINVDVLDNALTQGAVRYPGSGVPGVGNMFIFGHSTGIKIVQNKAYKVFNTIKNAKTGDEIQIFTEKNLYIYKVTSVEEVNKDETLVEFNTKGPATLTLSTCDSFGAKTDRFVVKAVFDKVFALR